MGAIVEIICKDCGEPFIKQLSPTEYKDLFIRGDRASISRLCYSCWYDLVSRMKNKWRLE
jgi:hypothetical protein